MTISFLIKKRTALNYFFGSLSSQISKVNRTEKKLALISLTLSYIFNINISPCNGNKFGRRRKHFFIYSEPSPDVLSRRRNKC